MGATGGAAAGAAIGSLGGPVGTVVGSGHRRRRRRPRRQGRGRGGQPDRRGRALAEQLSVAAVRGHHEGLRHLRAGVPLRLGIRVDAAAAAASTRSSRTSSAAGTRRRASPSSAGTRRSTRRGTPGIAWSAPSPATSTRTAASRREQNNMGFRISGAPAGAPFSLPLAGLRVAIVIGDGSDEAVDRAHAEGAARDRGPDRAGRPSLGADRDQRRDPPDGADRPRTPTCGASTRSWCPAETRRRSPTSPGPSTSSATPVGSRSRWRRSAAAARSSRPRDRPVSASSAARTRQVMRVARELITALAAGPLWARQQNTHLSA